MLIEFRVANYRSIRDTQTLSMVAAKDRSHLDTNCIESGIATIPHLTRSAVLYGPNASGKSNLIAALAFMRGMVENSATSIREGQTLDVVPFLLDPEKANQPTEMEVTFIENGIRYQYGFELTAHRIIKEWLFVYNKRKAQCWFSREYDEITAQENWNLGSGLTGGRQRTVWKDATRANALFLSAAINLNNEQLRPVFNWFVEKLTIIGNNEPIDPDFTIAHLKNELEKPKIIQFLKAADLGIVDVQVEMPVEKPAKTSDEIANKWKFHDIKFLHAGKNGDVGFGIDQESHGTRRLFSYAGLIYDALKKGHVMIIDELNSSLHPKLVYFLIELMHNSKLNSNGAQLIFSTHETALLDLDLFRRDQIWFIEKDHEQASRLYPLSDFSPRKNEALVKGYLMGRYGALPSIKDLIY